MLVLTDHMMTDSAVLCDANVCCAGQPVILVGDLNAGPLLIPSLAKDISDGRWVVLELAFADGRGEDLTPTCKGSLGDIVVVCSSALSASTACSVLQERWFSSSFCHPL